MGLVTAVVLGLLASQGAHAQDVSYPSTYPQNYTGIPKGGYGPDWQKYFQVTQPLPNVTFDTGRNWAGNIAVDRPGFSNDTLFFWAFERENGSLTAEAGERETEPWGIWLNGGPGSSSMMGLMWENGPIHSAFNGSMYANNYSWNKIADYFWLDQPVGVGFSTASSDGYIADENQMATDFWGFVTNLVKVFPSLATRPLHLTGESYAGTYIPYIMKGYFSMSKPPTKVVKIAIGNGAITDVSVFEDIPVVSLIETFPQLIGYNPDVYNYFAEQAHLCGLDLNLTYPQQGGHFPTLLDKYEDDSSFRTYAADRKSSAERKTALRNAALHLAVVKAAKTKRNLGLRNLEGRGNGTIDEWYGCYLFDELWDYAVNYTFPWNTGTPYANMDVHDVPDALYPEASGDPTTFFHDPETITALHAPTSQKWQQLTTQVFQGQEFDPSVPPIAFFDDLATNASAHNVSVVIFSGNDDSQIPHWGSEVVIQNTTFGGIQGFTRKPSTEWTTDDGKFAGIVHQERNWTYVLVCGAGHLVPQSNPAAAFVLAREFIFGFNQTGLVTNTSTSALGGETVNYTVSSHDVIAAAPDIFVGSGSTTSTVIAPSATIAAWDSFLATRVPSGSVNGSGGTMATESKNGGTHANLPLACFAVAQVVWFVFL